MDIKDNIWDYIKCVAQSANEKFLEMDSEEGLIDKQIYWVRQNVEMPDLEPFITLELSNSVQLGKDRKIISPPDSENLDVIERVKTFWNVDVDVNLYCKEAYTEALMFINSMRESNSLEQMRQSKLGIVSIGVVNDISAVVDTVWSGRAHFTIVFAFNYVKENNLTAIRHITLKGKETTSELEIDKVVDRPDVG